MDELLDFGHPEPEPERIIFRRPELLTHPQIPKPLHGVAPRVVLGKTWWDEHRKVAYAENHFHCWACGTPKREVKGTNKWLEAHESYDIDYTAGRVTMLEIVALCPYCHAFIHSGRTWALTRKGEKSWSECDAILAHGVEVLASAGLEPHWNTKAVLLMRDGMEEDEAIRKVGHLIPPEELALAPWSDWRLVIDGQEFEPKHKSFEDWAEYYGEGQDFPHLEDPGLSPVASGEGSADAELAWPRTDGLTPFD